MKNLILLITLIYSSFNVSGQVEPITLEFDSIRALTEFNTFGLAEAYPWISNDGLRIYFTQGGGGIDRIMYAERNSTDELFSTPVRLSINTELIGNISQWLSEDELHIYYISRESNDQHASTLYHATRSTILEEFDEPIMVEIIGDFDGFLLSPSLSKDLNHLFLFSNFILEKTDENEFTQINKINFPEGYLAGAGHLSQDGLQFISGMLPENTGRQDIFIAERDSQEDDFDSFYIIEGDQINNPDYSNILPYISKNNHFLAFTRNTTNSWNGNDLYLAYNFGPVATIDNNSQDKFTVKINPNPASEFINIDIENADCNSSDLVLTIFTSDGRLIESNTLSKTNFHLRLSTANYNSGLYYYKLNCAQESLSGSFIIKN